MTHLPYDVVNTHHHYDHVGGNGRFSMVYAHKKAIPVIQEQNNLQSRKEFFRSQEARPEYNYEASLEFDASIMGDFEMKGIEEGFVFHLGNRDLEVLDTPGHTKDGICLLDRKYRLLFSGDTVVSTPVLMFDTFSDTMGTTSIPIDTNFSTSGTTFEKVQYEPVKAKPTFKVSSFTLTPPTLLSYFQLCHK